MTRWVVEPDARGWSVVAYRDGVREEPRARFTGLACLMARVIVWELESAYVLGKDAAREEIFAGGLGDD